LEIDMSLVYLRVDALLSAHAGGEAREGDRLLLETDRLPRPGELALVREGRTEVLRRWDAAGDAPVVGVVIGVKRRLE
jgi:hypothetical protein